MKKKLKRIFKNEWVKKVIIIALAILVASITTSFCFGIKKAEGMSSREPQARGIAGHDGHAHEHGDDADDEGFDAEDTDKDDADDEDLTADTDEDGDEDGEDEDGEEDDDEDGEDEDEKATTKAKKKKKLKKEEPFKCEYTDGDAKKNFETLVSALKKHHDKLIRQAKKIDALEEEIENHKKQNKLLLEMIAEVSKANQRLSVMFETQVALSDPALTPDKMELALRELTTKKGELEQAIAQKQSLFIAINWEMRYLEAGDKLTPNKKKNYENQKAIIEKEISELRGLLIEVVDRAKVIATRRTQVTGQTPVTPFGPQTVQGQTPESAMQPTVQPVQQNAQDQLRAIIVALLRKGGNSSSFGRQPSFGPFGQTTSAPNRTIDRRRQPPLTGRGQRGIVAE